MKKKTLLTFAVSILCVACIAIGVGASALIEQISAELRSDFTIIIDGEEKTFEDVNGNVVEPILYDGTVYLPVRAIAEIMDKKVYWYEDEKILELKDENSANQTSIVTDADVIVGESAANSNPSPSGDANSETQISEERAKEIALEYAGLTADQVSFKRTELDREHGTLIYEIEFYQGTIEYSADISAADGTIISWEIDRD